MSAELTPEQREQIAHACDAAIDFGQTWIRFLLNGDETMLLPTVAAMLAAAKAEVLRETANAWTQGAWSDVMLPKPTPPAVPVIAYSNRVGDWLRARADQIEGPR